MLMLISPAKTLDYATALPTRRHSEPDFLDRSATLIDVLRQKSPAELSQLMSISDELAVLNAGRYQGWQPPFTPDNARPAVFAFKGDVYEGLNAYGLGRDAFDYLGQHLRILSGLYGLLKPFDLIQPYRLEMGTRLANPAGTNLYAHWGDTITDAVNDVGAGTLVNLASDEYFKSVKPKKLAAKLVTPVFEDFKGGRYKIISFYAKRARGLMVRYAALNRIRQPEALQGFDLDGYAFAPGASDAQRWVFRRQLAE
ncbi:peroxide stress protein YaaA [Jeongeupia sp. USM3]|uniref:peroxide stress protein YaaA n=1 Tax=Jeongeupia sp. USM3 TaxID=1906741 RepID=UPI00089DE415|nr:peroxide stress protein YaaA [Jeongeupia sp. USM3]AOY01328.1 peroxide stress protein YaaA [Jeongeupia sp. USM3]